MSKMEIVMVLRETIVLVFAFEHLVVKLVVHVGSLSKMSVAGQRCADRRGGLGGVGAFVVASHTTTRHHFDINSWQQLA